MAGNHIILTRNAALAAQQQKLGIAGTVTDASGEVLIGVSVLIKGSGQGIVTDLDGNFSLAANMGDILQFSYTGYIPQEIKLKDNHSLSIVLKEDVKSLDEVVVVAYGTQTKRAVTGAMETLDFDKLSDVPVAQFTQKDARTNCRCTSESGNGSTRTRNERPYSWSCITFYRIKSSFM